MSDKTEAKQIFIVCEKHEVELAALLKGLFESWGLNPYYYQQDIDVAAAARKFNDVLQLRLRKADLIILLLSRDFEWSKYCQIEAGATMMLNKPRIIITIPPVDQSKVGDISPVLDGYNALVPNPKVKVEQLKAAVDKAIGTDLYRKPATQVDNDFEKKIGEMLLHLAHKYRILPSKTEQVRVWPCITKKCPDAQTSIVEHIKESINNGQPRSEIALVGISLKYSLDLVTRALVELSASIPPASPEQGSEPAKRKKTLSLRFVHMNDHSHILRAINDNFDINTIKKRLLDTGWAEKKEAWLELAGKCSIELDTEDPCGIDYIPPQLGICIDETTLFSGHCAFEDKGVEHHLLVGELEYIHFTHEQERGRKAIQEFRQAFEIYKKPSHNAGIALARDSEDWVKHLMDALSEKCGHSEITVMSQTATKLADLIEKGLRLGLVVNVYVERESQDMPNDVKARIESSITRLKFAENSYKGRLQIERIERPMYRIALIGNELLGYQSYEQSGDYLKAGPLRLIVTKASHQFENLKKSLIPAVNGALHSRMSPK